MAGGNFTSKSITIGLIQNSGGLNSTASPIGVSNNEASDIQNIDFDRFGAFKQRNGFNLLNSLAGFTFTGSGLDDGAFTGQYSGSGQVDYRVVIDATGTPDTFEWFIDSGSGFVSQASGVAITGSAQTLSNGVRITFDATTGHTVSDRWDITVPTGINSGAPCTSLHYYENRTTDMLLGTFGDTLYKMESFDGIWDDITATADEFDGTGLDDATWSGTLSTTEAPELRVEIDALGTPDTFKWYLNGVEQATGVAITGAAQLLSNGISITFASTTLHTVGDKWYYYPELTISSSQNSQFNWITFNNSAYGTNGVNFPVKVNDTAGATNFAVPTDLTRSKYIESFENYCFLANSEVDSTERPTRLYWSALDNAESWDAADFVEIGLDDGEDITGLKKLGDRIVIYKERSVYVGLFTGDADIPFVFKKTPSEVGCVSGLSVQEVRNGHVFLSVDGLYFFDGFNSTKLSDRVTTTIESYNANRMAFSVSGYQKTKNKYWVAMTSSGSGHDKILTYDFYNNAFSVYDGINANALTVLNISGEERVYFGNYTGFACQADVDNEIDDKSDANVDTSVDSFYKTKWFDFGDVVAQKGIAHAVFYYDFTECNLTYAYSYDLEDGNSHTQLYSLSQNAATWQGPPGGSGTGVWYDTVNETGSFWAKSGGSFQRVDHKGRGRLMRIIFQNLNVGETYKVNAYGLYVHLETVAG